MCPAESPSPRNSPPVSRPPLAPIYAGSFDLESSKTWSSQRHGLEIIKLDPAKFLPLPDGGHFTLWQDREKTLQEIARHSESDAQAYPKFVELVEAMSGFLRQAFSQPAPRPESTATGDVWELLKLGIETSPLGTKNMQQTLRSLPTSVADLLNEWFESEPLKACSGGARDRGC